MKHKMYHEIINTIYRMAIFHSTPHIIPKPISAPGPFSS